MKTTWCLVVLVHHYASWSEEGDPGNEEEGIPSILDYTIHDEEEIGSPRVLGIYTTATDAASACYSILERFIPSEDDTYGGPIESMSVYAVPLGRQPVSTNRFLGAGLHLVDFRPSDTNTGSVKKLHALISRACRKHLKSQNAF